MTEQPQLLELPLKRCSVCKELKPINEFNRNKRKNDGLDRLCKPCANAYQKQHRIRNPRKAQLTERKRHIRRKFGVTNAWYLAQSRKQEFQCAICKRTKENKKGRMLHIDHNHKTLKIRGLLCNYCNVGLGHFLENKGLLSKAIEYLEMDERSYEVSYWPHPVLAPSLGILP